MPLFGKKRDGDPIDGPQLPSADRFLPGGGQQVVGMGVGVRRHLQRDALVQMVGGHLVQVGARVGLETVQACSR